MKGEGPEVVGEIHCDLPDRQLGKNIESDTRQKAEQPTGSNVTEHDADAAPRENGVQPLNACQ